MQIPFGEWLPDQPEHGMKGANVATNVYHALGSYKRFPSLVSYSTNNIGKEVFSTIDMPYGKQVIWPPHCIFNTKGSEFHKELQVKHAIGIIRKGFRKEIDSYSGFFENDRVTPTGMEGLLKSLKIKRVFVCGLALDFCVNYTALDAKSLGFETIVLKDATLPVDIGNSIDKTLQGFRDNQIKFAESKDFF